MATTPNYGWVMPDPTDFVTDLPADFEIFGDAADASVKALNPGTTAGDVDYYTSGTAKARLAIGTAGQVLAVNTGATAPEWVTSSSGGMTAIASGSLSGAEVSLTGIVGTYKNLQLIVRDFANATGSSNLQMRINTLSTNIYADKQFTSSTRASTAVETIIEIGRYNGAADGASVVNFYDYADTTTDKIGDAIGWSWNGASSGDFYAGYWAVRTTTAITSIQLSFANSADFNAGTYTLYGVS
jgi:hypothetical protein